MRSLQQLADDVFTGMGTTADLAAARITPAQVVDMMNKEFQLLGRVCREKCPSLFHAFSALTLVQDVETALPEDCAEILDLSTDCNLTGMPGRSLGAIDFSYGDREAHRSGYERTATGIILRRMSSGPFILRYARNAWPALNYGTLAAYTNGCPILPAIPTAGPPVPTRDDYLKGLTLMLVAGPGSTDWRTITGMTGATLAVAVSRAFGVSPTNATTFCTLPPWPEELHRVLVHAAIAAMPDPAWRDTQNPNELAGMRQMVADWAAGIRKETTHMGKAFSRAMRRDADGYTRGSVLSHLEY